MTYLEEAVLAWWRDQWGGAPTDTVIAGRTEHGMPSIDETEITLMRAAEALARATR